MKSLYASGIQHVVISPGSRSTPLALAALSLPQLQCHVVVDERSASFFALGQIRATGLATALICTSGSAGAHYFPAIIEASLSHLPLVVITADRPWELQQCGANQTTCQQNLYGAHVKNFFELGETIEINGNPNNAQHAIRVGAQAVYTAMAPARGPVHINARCRKPLDPTRWPLDSQTPTGNIPNISPPTQLLSDEAVNTIVNILHTNSRGIIVCGPGPMTGENPSMRDALCKFAASTGFPILAELASGVRGTDSAFVQHASSYFSCVDAGLLMPELIVEIHRPLTVSSYEQFVSHHPEIQRLVISNDRFVDFTASASAVFVGDISDALQRANRLLQPISRTDWKDQFRFFDAVATREMIAILKSNPDCDASMLHETLLCLERDNVLCLGNSLIVRDAELFPSSPACKKILHQRGASGIDGLISAAAGTASVEKKGVVLLLGDVSALHDLGGFALLHSVTSPLVVLIINNNGGQIFRQLPLGRISDIDDILSSGFVIPGTPQFKGICDMFNIHYTCTSNREHIHQLLQDGLRRHGATVIELSTNTCSTNYRQEYIQALRQKLAQEKPA